MKELSEIIKERDDKFTEATIEIFLSIDLCIEVVEEFLCSIDSMFAAGHFTWNDVYLEDDLITLLGMVEFDIGITIETDEGTVNITDDNVEYFQRVVRMALPYKLVTTGTRDEITVFMEKLHLSGKGQGFNEQVINPAPTEKSEFDLSKLSTEQQAALKLYNINKQTNN